MKTDTRMLPCPFCGSSKTFVEPDEIGSGGQWVGPLHIGCDRYHGCGAQIMIDACEADAIAAWNRRATATPPVDGEAKMREALEAVAAALGEFGWSLTMLNRARPLIREALASTQVAGGGE